MNQQENDKQTTLEDLGVDEARQDEVKGGPRGSSGPGIYRSIDSGQTWVN
jgi:hypothetical protein